MNRKLSMSLGVVFLVLGMLLVVQSGRRLRADPPPCPMQDLSSQLKDCEVSTPCEGSGDNIAKCEEVGAHWEVVAFPKECVTTTEKKKCDLINMKCQTNILCEYDDTAKPPCRKKAKQPDFPMFKNALKLVPSNCPP